MGVGADDEAVHVECSVVRRDQKVRAATAHPQQPEDLFRALIRSASHDSSGLEPLVPDPMASAGYAGLPSTNSRSSS